MAIALNSIVRNVASKSTFRAIDVVNADQLGQDDACDYLILFDLDPSKASMPQPIKYPLFLEQLAAKEWRLLETNDPSTDLAKLTPSELECLARRWQILQMALAKGAQLYCPHNRSELARDFANQGVATRPYLYSVLRSFWRNGMTKQALVPQFRHCGAPGVDRIASEAAKKVGRRRSITPGAGTAMTQEHRAKIALAIARTPFGKRQHTLGDTYNWMLLKLYPDCTKVVPGERDNLIQVTLPDLVPSYDQFFYQWSRLNSWSDRQRLKSPKGFDRLTRVLSTGTFNEVRGPGSRYYIDATILDFYIVSRFNPSRILGRPTLYIVVDEFSHLDVGFYLGLEPPCWVGAMLALWSCNLDKVALCAKYGIDIKPQEWPTGYMPLHLMGDRGELASKQSVALADGFKFDVENARPYTGEAKGLVERDFRTLQAEFGPWLPGHVDKTLASRDADPPALSAAMDLDHATRMIILRILLKNHRVIRDYEGSPQQTVAGVSFRPIELWHWGERNLRSEYRQYSEDHLIRYLWPEKKLKFNQKGLKFYRGMHFMGLELRDKPWFHRALVERDEVEARYHPQMLDRVFVLPNESHSAMVEVGVSRRSAKFSHQSESELHALEFQKDRQNAEATWKAKPRAAEWTGQIDETRKDALKRARESADPSLSKAERLRGMRTNRADELDAMAEEAVHKAFVHPKDVQPAPEQVIEDANANAIRAEIEKAMRRESQ